MKKRVFIQTNNKQILGAYISKYSIEKYITDKDIKIELINTDELPEFKAFHGVEYLRNGKNIKYASNDLQSFTLTRFMPPELMNFEGRALVIDPDVFALKDISYLLSFDMSGKSVAACRKKDAWDTSMMVLDCSKLKNWRISEILKKLTEKNLDYGDLISLRTENYQNILEVPRIWNNLDTLTPETYLLHTTNRLTQPWRTGLPIDFTMNNPGKILGLIPKKPILKILGKWPTHYEHNPDKNIEKFFFDIAKEAFMAGAFKKSDLEKAINSRDVRPDIFEKLGV